MIDRRPAAIALCASVNDVHRAIEFGRRLELPIAIRGGGHNVAGNGTCEGGLLDQPGRPPFRPGRCRSGARTGRWRRHLGRLRRRHHGPWPGDAGRHRLQHRGGGADPRGGIGVLRGRHGLTCDNLVGAELVTANGEVARVGRRGTRSCCGACAAGAELRRVTALEFGATPAERRRSAPESSSPTETRAPSSASTVIRRGPAGRIFPRPSAASGP